MMESDPLGFAAALFAMTLACYVMRAGGYWLIGRFALLTPGKTYSLRLV